MAIGNVDGNMTIVRYNANGSIDNTFGTSGILQPNVGYPGTLYDVALDSNGKIIVAGSVTKSGILNSLVIRCTSTGILDTTFNTTGYVIQSIQYGSEYFSVVVQSNNNIIVAGYTVSPLSNELSIARYLTSNGTLDPTYGTNGITITNFSGDTAVQDVRLQSTGNAITAGLTNGTFFLERYLA